MTTRIHKQYINNFGDLIDNFAGYKSQMFTATGEKITGILVEVEDCDDGTRLEKLFFTTGE